MALSVLQEDTHLYFIHRPASWTAVFNAMPTICFGFQVPAARSLLSPELIPSL